MDHWPTHQSRPSRCLSASVSPANISLVANAFILSSVPSTSRMLAGRNTRPEAGSREELSLATAENACARRKASDIGRDHVRTPATNAQHVYRLLLENKTYWHRCMKVQR